MAYETIIISLILVVVFLLVIILFLLVATRRQISRMSISYVPVAVPVPQPKIISKAHLPPEQPKVVEKIEEEIDEAVEKVQPEVIEKEVKQPQKEVAEKEEPPEIFKCRKCNKEFNDKKKLQRHIGMAHYQDLKI